MGSERVFRIKRLAAGFLTALAVTLIGMTLMTLAVLFLSISDGTVTLLNQVVKLLSVFAGTRAAVRRGGHNGLLMGAATAALYMIAGYALYALLGGAAFSFSDLLGEILLGAAAGGAFGAIFSNLPAKR